MAAPDAGPEASKASYSVKLSDVEADHDKEDLDSDDASAVKVLDYMSKEANDSYDPANFDPTLYDQPPEWRTQFSFRSALCTVVLGFILSFINLRGNLIVGTGPPTTVPSGMLTYLFIKVFTVLASKAGISQTPFTRQENTVVQTAIVAAVAMTWGGGFSGQLFSLEPVVYTGLGGPSMPGNRIQDTMHLTVKNVAPLMPVIAFAGPFMLISLRKLIVIDMDLAWPSGTAVGVLMNSFHSGKSSVAAARQVRSMLEWFLATFLWSFTRWFFSGYNGLCGYEKTPLFGLKAKYYGWYYEFMTMYVGAGMIAPRLVSASMMLGAVIAYGILWPIVMGKAGQWYALKTVGTSSFSGLYGYQVCCGIALMLGDCVFNLTKVGIISTKKYMEVRANRKAAAGASDRSLDPGDIEFVDTYVESKYNMNTVKETPLQRRLRQYYFYRDNIPGWVGAVSYVALTAMTAVLIPLVYPQVKWYWIPVSMFIAVPLSVANAYSTGLTDYNLGSTYAKVAVIVFASIVGLEKGGVVVGLLLSILIKATSNNAVEMCQDFRTGYLTMSSAKSMVAAQLFGAFVGMFTAPLCYFIFADAFALGVPGSLYSVPYGAIYRNIAVVGVDGFGVLPMYCLWMSFAFFIVAIMIDVVREVVSPKWKRFVPYPVAMSLTFYLGTYLAMDYSVGAISRFLWGLKDPASEALLMPAVATGLIVGDGMGAFPGAIVGLFKVQPPMCLNFVPSNPKNSAFPSGYGHI